MSFAFYIALLSIIVAMIFARNSKISSLTHLFLIILLCHGYVTTWSTMKQISGYPTAEDLPEEFEVLWARVVESGDEDFIELWIAHDTPPTGKIMARFSLAHGWNNVSRVYRIPYSEANHQTVLEVQGKVRSGIKVGMIFDANHDGEIDLREAEQRYSIAAEAQRIRK